MDNFLERLKKNWDIIVVILVPIFILCLFIYPSSLQILVALGGFGSAVATIFLYLNAQQTFSHNKKASLKEAELKYFEKVINSLNLEKHNIIHRSSTITITVAESHYYFLPLNNEVIDTYNTNFLENNDNISHTNTFVSEYLTNRSEEQNRNLSDFISNYLVILTYLNNYRKNNTQSFYIVYNTINYLYLYGKHLFSIKQEDQEKILKYIIDKINKEEIISINYIEKLSLIEYIILFYWLYDKFLRKMKFLLMVFDQELIYYSNFLITHGLTEDEIYESYSIKKLIYNELSKQSFYINNLIPTNDQRRFIKESYTLLNNLKNFNSIMPSNEKPLYAAKTNNF